MKAKKILPSKKFILVIGAAVVAVIIVFLSTSYFGSKEIFQNSQDSEITAGDNTVAEAIDRDSNNNGIPDWEEVLWGLDPKADGATNKKIIEEKEAAAGINTASSSQAPLTATEQFSQQLLSTVVALKETGNLNADTMQSLSDSLDADIAARETTTMPYADTDILANPDDSQAAYQAYRDQFKELFAEYQNSGIGNEFDIIEQGLTDGAPSDTLAALDPIAQQYIAFSKKIIALSMPEDAVPTALEFANENALVGEALLKLEQLNTDSMTGMVGLDEYVNNIDSYTQASQDIVTYFSTKDASYANPTGQ